MESAGTLPCALEIPDCVEQVRGAATAEGLGSLQPPALPCLVFRLLAFASPFWCQGDPRAPSEGPLASKSRKRFWNWSSADPWEATAEGVGAGSPHRAPSPPRRSQGEAELQRESGRLEVNSRQGDNFSLFSDTSWVSSNPIHS